MEHIDYSSWRIKPNSSVKLHEIDTWPKPKDVPSDDAWRASLHKLGDKLNKLQGTLYAGKSKGLLLVLQGMDTAGKDGRSAACSPTSALWACVLKPLARPAH